ncbi:MAG: hypothetical protein FWD19_02665 [Defluviitaleaceae bacterium]|nr:hypothetical protein [Defluviitaleaceae bacterium]
MNWILNSIIFFASVAAMIFLVIKSSSHRKKQDEINKNFLEREEAANAVRKKEIDPHLFFEADLSHFPKISEDDPFQIIRCSKRVMIRFETPVTNLELKNLYGLSQMDLIAQYEENFNAYLKSLTQWAASLAEKNSGDALKIVEYVISLGGEFRDSYKIAADIYAKNGEQEKLDALTDAAEQNYFNDPSIRKQIIDYINMKEIA